MNNTEPTTYFFRRLPDNWEQEYVVSSLQSLESSFFLIALDRYPHALTVGASAIESVLKSASSIKSHDRPTFEALIDRGRDAYPLLREVSKEALDRLRVTRNRFTHRGFSSKDNGIAVGLYLDVALPFLSRCYQAIHSFDIEDGLLRDYVESLNVARRVHDLVRGRSDIDLSYCLNGFGHMLRWVQWRNFSPRWQNVSSDESNPEWERKYTWQEALKKEFDVWWEFDCPVCDGFESVVAELDSESLDADRIRALRMVCAECDFYVGEQELHLADTLLQKQLEDQGIVERIREEWE